MEPSADPRSGVSRDDRDGKAPAPAVDLAGAGLDRIERRLRDLERQLAELRDELCDLSSHLERQARR